MSRPQVRWIRSTFTRRGDPNYSPSSGVSSLANQMGVDTNEIYQVVSHETYREVA